MGLPVWRVPSPEPQRSLKADCTVPARSPIRRRPHTTRRARRGTHPRSPRPDVRLSTPALVADLDYLPSLRHLSPPLLPPPVPESRNYARNGDSARDLTRSPFDDERLTHLQRQRYYRSMYNNTAGLSNVSHTSREPAPLTAHFAPAHTASSGRERSELRSVSPYSHARESPPSPRRSPVAYSRTDDDNSNLAAVGFPPLRRMGNRTIADGPLPSSSLRESWSPTATLDGLGDRERSISPVDDHWEIMLTTVAPDPLPPSVDSSFTSAAASASFSGSNPSSRAGSANSNSASSSRTHLTIPSQRASPPVDAFLRACDTDTDSASDTEDDNEARLVAAHRMTRMRHSNPPPSRESRRYSRDPRNRSRGSSAYVRSHYDRSWARREQQRNDQLDGPGELLSPIVDELQTLDQELLDARALLERLSRREDIPDDYWASVGLTRSMAERVRE